VTSDGGSRSDPEVFLDAVMAASRRIAPTRKKMRLEDAEDIVRAEFVRRDAAVSAETASHLAKVFHRGPSWPFRHPWQARREGVRFGWARSGSEAEDVPAVVEELANREAWRCTGRGAGPLSEGLEPAECRRVSKTAFFCVAEVLDEAGLAIQKVEIRIAYRPGGAPTVKKVVLKQV
jgi:hypothetical protein